METTTVGRLKALLANHPDNMEVWVSMPEDYANDSSHFALSGTIEVAFTTCIEDESGAVLMSTQQEAEEHNTSVFSALSEEEKADEEIRADMLIKPRKVLSLG